MANEKRLVMMVSVIMITYNHEQYIAEAINGILMQQCDFDVELIIANDCSPDNTDKIVNDIIINHANGSWIKYTKHQQNKGMSRNFIWAAEQATGKYIALCEGDDYWTDPLKVQKQVDFLEENENYSFCTHRFEMLREVCNKDKAVVINARKNYITKYANRFYKDENLVIDYDMFYKAWITQPLTTVFRNKYTTELIAYAEKFSYFRDVHLFYFLLKKNNGYSFRDYMAVYRQHPNGAETGGSRSEKLLIKKEIWSELFKNNPSDDNLRAQYIQAALRLMRRVDNKAKIRLYKESIIISNKINYFLKVNYNFISYFNYKNVL